MMNPMCVQTGRRGLGVLGHACPVLVVWVVLGGSAQAGQTSSEGTASAGGQTVAMLPFVNTSGAPQDRWIGQGIVETLASDLPTQAGVTVADRRAVGRGEDDGTAIQEVRAHDAAWLVEGSYQRVGDDLRIIARLVEVETGLPVHTVKVDGSFDELFDLQDRVVAELVDAIRTRQHPPSLAVRGEPARVAQAAQPRSAPPITPDSGSDAPSILTGATPDRSPALAPSPAAPAVVAPSTAAGLSRPVSAIDGPPPPMPPAVISREIGGRATVRATRITSPIRLDGTLDEPVYRDVRAMSDFVQVEPNEGAPATEKTEAWVLFDDDNVYVSARAWDSAPESEWIANEMRRDSTNLLRNEGVHISFDTFYDRRNNVIFNVSPIGGRMDGQSTDERAWNGDWNPIWDVQTGRFEGGWTMEAAIPFKSLRYRPGLAQIWGFNLIRIVQWKNERSSLTPLPAARGLGGQFMASLSATLVGVEAPAGGSRTLELKPYAISEVAGTRNDTRELSDDVAGDLGFDVKYGITENFVADLTVNTDFAQVEADTQQVNLTRFSLFFPEKREFFLENQGTFSFGGARSAGARGGGTDVPVLFYSREIGLDGGQEVPIEVGGRLTGRVGRFSIGVMNIQSGGVPEIGATGTNFTVARIRRDILRRSNIGVLFTGRSVSKEGTGSSETYGVDGVFAFYDNLNINTYWAKTQTPELRGNDVSYRGQLDYNGDRYGVQAERLVVGRDFNPEVGFLRRNDFDRRFGSFRFSPRPERFDAVRKFTYQGQVAYVLDRTGLLETREAQGQFGMELENADSFNVTHTRSYEFLKQPFRIAPGVTIPVGGYAFADTQVSFTLGPQRLLAGAVSVQHGSFFSGDKTTVGFNRGRLELTPQLSVEPGVSYNRIDLPEGRFTTNLVTTRTTYTVTPLMFVSALLQYNSSSHALSTNVRLRWEYQPGSELFVVYNEQRDTLAPTRLPELANRAFIVKVNRLFRF